ncbi:hypothetical protein VKT23_008990 [Stygiomarasmius scandens]|uniref:Heterokaryon incompatibility domain-containing protein n=1 Tax=Marasmiellus scandens TaxID=2682957 RepID=A0ABR1JG48_9AGAR
MPTTPHGSYAEAHPRRLIDTRFLRLFRVKKNAATPPYVILSHIWVQDEEVSYREFLDGGSNVESKPGYKKIREACSKALELGFQYLWVDTCCVDQGNHTEVARNIQSMYFYHRNSEACLVHLFDISGSHKPISRSEWFKRGRSVQELVASQAVLFFNRDWDFRGNKLDFKQDIEVETRLPGAVLDGTISVENVDIWERYEWFRERITRKPQDLLYFSMGILGIKLEVRHNEDTVETFHRFWHSFVHFYPNARRIFPVEGQNIFLPFRPPMTIRCYGLPNYLNWPPRQSEFATH